MAESGDVWSLGDVVAVVPSTTEGSYGGAGGEGLQENGAV